MHKVPFSVPGEQVYRASLQQPQDTLKNRRHNQGIQGVQDTSGGIQGRAYRKFRGFLVFQKNGKNCHILEKLVGSDSQVDSDDLS